MRLSRLHRRLSRQFRSVAGFRTPRVDRAELVASVAERLTALDRAEFLIRGRVLRNDGRRLLAIHEVFARAAAGSLSAPILRLVEKRAREPQEYRFYRSAVDGRTGPRLAPELYASIDDGFLTRDPRRYAIVIEHMPRRGLPDLSARSARELADSIANIAGLPMELDWRQQRYNRLSDRILSRFVGLLERSGWMDDAATRAGVATMSKNWPRLAAIAKMNLPWLPSHNDLHLDNLCQVEGPSGAQFVFIDWEAFGLNHAGADLHHFIREGLVKPAAASFSATLLQRYAERMRDKHGLDTHVVAIGAHAYALRRSMRRALVAEEASDVPVSLQLFDKLLGLLT